MWQVIEYSHTYAPLIRGAYRFRFVAEIMCVFCMLTGDMWHTYSVEKQRV